MLFDCHQTFVLNLQSISTQCSTLQLQNSSILLIVGVPVACCHVWDDWLVSWRPLQVSCHGFTSFKDRRLTISGEKYLASNSSGILWLGAGGIWLSAFMMIFLPVEMRDRQMF